MNGTATFAEERQIAPGVRLLDLKDKRWQNRLAGAVSVALLVAVWFQLSSFGYGRLVSLLPSSPLFYVALAGLYFLVPASEWLIFRRLWALPASGIVPLLRKRVVNELLLGYGGEVYFYAWARSKTHLTTAPFGAIKDVSILSALAGNAVTLLMVAGIAPFAGALIPPSMVRPAILSVALMLALPLVAMLFRKHIFSLAAKDLWAVFAIHVARLVLTTVFCAWLWHVALPDVPLMTWLALATIRMLVSRLPLVPNKDMVFAGVSIVMVGGDPALGALMALTGTLTLAIHMILVVLLSGLAIAELRANER
jgi:hypothetical protein